MSASAVFFAAATCIAIPASAQTLALTYKLDPRAEPLPQAPTTVNRCAGLNWMTAIGACGRELFARVTPARTSDGAYAKANSFDPTEVAVAPDLPTLGAQPAEPRVRSVSGKETVLGSSRTADLMLRLGSKYRRAVEESGWNPYKFTDMNYESHVQNNGHKAVGVELLVPFQ
jgi:hypothetical protein